MMWRITLCLLVLWPAAVSAQVVRIQSGEHASFTRLVLEIPVGANWRLGRDATGYVLRVPNVAGYDLSGVYNLIPRDRVAAVRQRANVDELALTVICRCNVDAFLFRPDLLVIDIRDGLPTPGALFEQAFDPVLVPEWPVVAVQEPPRPAAPFQISRNPVLPILTPRGGVVTSSEEPATEVIVETAEDVPTSAAPGEADDIANDLAALEAAITESLARGLTDGALDGAVPDEGANAQDTDDISAALEALGLPGVNARTGVDPRAIPERAPADVTQDGNACLPDSYFAVPAWGTDAPFFDQINPARSALLGEFDAVDSEAVIALARLYVYFGFGREAQQALTLDDVRSQERRYVTAMARIIDADPVMPGQFDGQVSCPGPVALWAMLADEAPPLDAQVDRAAVLRNFRELPTRLQAHLAPRLSDRFVAIGDLDAALKTLAPAQSQTRPPVEAALADATLSEALGEEEQAIEAVTTVAREDPRATPEAMIRFLEDGIAAGVAFTDTDFLNADTMRFELGGGEAAATLAAAQVNALISVDRFAQADALLAKTAADLGDGAAPLADDLVIAATARMADAGFLGFVWDRDIAARSAAAQNTVATRLLELGFPERANAVLTVEPSTEEQLLLLARADLATGDVDRALSTLAAMTGEMAEDLRAEAVALRAAQSATALLDAGLSAVPAEDALDLLQAEDAVLAELATAVRGEEPRALSPNTPLMQSRSLLERSAQSRDLLQQMLNRFEAPAEF